MVPVHGEARHMSKWSEDRPRGKPLPEAALIACLGTEDVPDVIHPREWLFGPRMVECVQASKLVEGH